MFPRRLIGNTAGLVLPSATVTTRASESPGQWRDCAHQEARPLPASPSTRSPSLGTGVARLLDAQGHQKPRMFRLALVPERLVVQAPAVQFASFRWMVPPFTFDT